MGDGSHSVTLLTPSLPQLVLKKKHLPVSGNVYIHRENGRSSGYMNLSEGLPSEPPLSVPLESTLLTREKYQVENLVQLRPVSKSQHVCNFCNL